MRLLDYIRGLRKGKEAHRIEREAMEDPFLSDALEGFDRVKGDHARRIEDLQRQLSARTTIRRNHYRRNWSIAASLLIAILGGSYFLWIKAPEIVPPKEIAAIEKKSHRDYSSPDSQPLASKVEKDSATRPEEMPVLQIGKEVRSKRSDLAVTHRKETPQTIQEETVNVKMTKEVANVEESLDVSASRELVAKASERRAIREDSDYKAVVANTVPVQQVLTGKVAGVKLTPEGTIKGIVTDKESGEPIIGANIMVKGTTQGTLTNTDGYFTLDAQGKKLVVNYIGYEPIELKADSSKNMLIAMAPDKTMLDEVVVVGYGTQKKRSVTGSIATVGPADPSSEPLDGWRSYRKYMKKNLKKPTEGDCKDVTGTVTLSFRVDTNGRPIDIAVMQSLCPETDTEALRLLQEGPAWKQNSGRTTLEIKF